MSPSDRPFIAIDVPVTRADHGADLDLPAYQSDGAAGMDLVAAVDEDMVVQPGETVLVPTGLHFAVPHGFEAQVRPRSGLALRHGITVTNSPGTIDCDYRGEVKVILSNVGREAFTIERGMRVAQVVFAPVARATWQEVKELPDTDRGAGGFGHTGVE